MKAIDIVDLIPYGHNHAVTLEDLAWQTDLDKRSIRQAIADSRELIINLQDGQGYFKPAVDEGNLVNEWIFLMDSRAREISKRVRRARKWFGRP